MTGPLRRPSDLLPAPSHPNNSIVCSCPSPDSSCRLHTSGYHGGKRARNFHCLENMFTCHFDSARFDASMNPWYTDFPGNSRVEFLKMVHILGIRLKKSFRQENTVMFVCLCHTSLDYFVFKTVQCLWKAELSNLGCRCVVGWLGTAPE